MYVFKPQTFQIVQHISQDQGVFQDFGRTERRRVTKVTKTEGSRYQL